ncbi:MAG: hypothetical protein IMZ75_07010 [Actinobacteria bacterium]|nr:hypothetical protein [Actinomycetota bacterium]
MQHAVYVLASGLVTMYLDGAQVGSLVTDNDDFVPNAFGNIAIATGGWEGSVGAARLYPFALTSEQVAQNYAAGPDW